MNQEKIRVGLIGVGGVCDAVHYPGFKRIPEVEIVGICEPNDQLRRARQNDWKIDKSFADADEFFEKVSPDAVAIATPNVFHKTLIDKAFKSESHVLCEKPLGMNYQETQELYETAKRSGLRHMTAFTYRFVPALNFIRDLVQRGELGTIRHARFQRLQDWGEEGIGWRQYKNMAGSGELGDMGIHRIDFAEDLLGPIMELCAGAKQLLEREKMPDGSSCRAQDVEDWVSWIAEFEGGTTGVFEMGKLSKGFGPAGDHDQAELNGTNGSVVYRLHSPHEILFGRRGEPYEVLPVPEEFLKRPGSPRNPSEGDPIATFRYDQAWEFVSAIRENRECVPSFYHGMRAQAVADAILLAVKERRWVQIERVSI